MDATEVSAEDYQAFSQFLERKCGIVLGTNKQYLVRSRLMPLVREKSFASLTELLQAVVKRSNRQLEEVVVDAMTTNETLWFRDVYPFELLKSSLLPAFNTLKRPLKIWSAACSSGQEPYSIAMTLLEYKANHPSHYRQGFRVTATDLSSDMLKRAARGQYDALSIVRGLSDERKRRFFTPAEDGNFQLKPQVQNLVTFRPINLLDSYSGLGKFDIVFCRNVLIYFSADVKRKILQQIAASLEDSGILILGASESLSGVSENFDMIRCSPGLYYRKKTL